VLCAALRSAVLSCALRGLIWVYRCLRCEQLYRRRIQGLTCGVSVSMLLLLLVCIFSVFACMPLPVRVLCVRFQHRALQPFWVLRGWHVHY
jgi:hypothetical protein